MTETIARKLLHLVDWLIDEHFFQKIGLIQLGWCSHYMLDRRSVNYHKEKQSIIGLIVLQIDLTNNNL